MSKRKNPRADDPTVVFRKQAVWLFPSIFLIHSLIVYGAYRPLTQMTLFAALGSAVVGFASRWTRNLRVVHALALFLLAFFMLYTMGVVAPIAFLVLVERRDLIGAVGGTSVVALTSLVAWRTRASLRQDWSLPLEQSPGVILYPHDNTLVRVAVKGSGGYLGAASMVMLTVLVFGLVTTHGTARYLFVAMVAGPLFIAFIGCDLVSRMLAFLIVTRRWEIQHGAKLKAPPMR
jgi:hypothetical protein